MVVVPLAGAMVPRHICLQVAFATSICKDGELAANGH